MDAALPEIPSHVTTPAEVAALWERVDALGQANMASAYATQSGRLEAAAEADADAPSWDEFVACLSNTPPQSSAVPIPGFPELMATVGIDWWEWTASVSFEPAKLNELSIKLDALKKQCQELREPNAWLKINGLPSLGVGRTGFNRGGDRGEYFDYKLKYCGVPFGIANRQGTADSIPNLCVAQRGSECLRMGAIPSQDKIRTLVQWMGGTIVREKLSRADICIDIPNLDIRTFQPYIQNRQFVSKAKTIQPYENVATDEWTGFVVGKRPMRIVVYDKVRELAHKHDDLYLQTMIARRWGKVMPEQATRIEIQISREWFRKFGIDSPSDFIQNAAGIIQRQLLGWFRLTTERVESEKKTQSRMKTDPLWLALTCILVNWFGRPHGELALVPRKNVRPIRSIRQGVGNLRSALLQMGYVLPRFQDLRELIGIALDLAYPSHEDRERFVDDYRGHFSEFQT